MYSTLSEISKEYELARACGFSHEEATEIANALVSI
jgi:hypothetical protein